jgi:catechol 2,3-dioxygenase
LVDRKGKATDLMAQTPQAPVLHHVNIKTTRLEEMTAFYGLVTQMEVVFTSPGISFLRNDHANHRIALISLPDFTDDPGKLARAGMHHVAFEHETVVALVEAYRRLRDEGVVPHLCVDHGMTLSMYYVDPDGNSLELQCDSFGDWAASTEWMTSSQDFVANPLGTFFDPEQLAVACDETPSLAELHRRAYAGEFEPSEPPDLRLPAPPQ